MGRAPREIVPGGVYHVYARGSNRQAIFAYDSDRVDFLDCLDRAVRTFELRCLAYCLMSNHYHLVLQDEVGALSRALKALNGRYALRFNRRYGRDAHLFRNRFGSVLQEGEEQLLATLRYTALNPVAKGLCATAEEWRWSSYRASAGLDPTPRLLDLDLLWTYFGRPSDQARSMYVAYVNGLDGV